MTLTYFTFTPTLVQETMRNYGMHFESNGSASCFIRDSGQACFKWRWVYWLLASFLQAHAWRERMHLTDRLTTNLPTHIATRCDVFNYWESEGIRENCLFTCSSHLWSRKSRPTFSEGPHMCLYLPVSMWMWTQGLKTASVGTGTDYDIVLNASALWRKTVRVFEYFSTMERDGERGRLCPFFIFILSKSGVCLHWWQIISVFKDVTMHRFIFFSCLMNMPVPQCCTKKKGKMQLGKQLFIVVR